MGAMVQIWGGGSAAIRGPFHANNGRVALSIPAEPYMQLRSWFHYSELSRKPCSSGFIASAGNRSKLEHDQLRRHPPTHAQPALPALQMQ